MIIVRFSEFGYCWVYIDCVKLLSKNKATLVRADLCIITIRCVPVAVRSEVARQFMLHKLKEATEVQR
jgi:hypothetical protein